MSDKITIKSPPISNQEAIVELEQLIESIRTNHAYVTEIKVTREYYGRCDFPGRLKTIEIRFASDI